MPHSFNGKVSAKGDIEDVAENKDRNVKRMWFYEVFWIGGFGVFFVLDGSAELHSLLHYHCKLYLIVTGIKIN